MTTLMFLSPPCASTAAWGRVVSCLGAHDDVSVELVQLPSCEPGSEANDVDVARAHLDRATDAVVMVNHSSGGLLLSEVGDHPNVRHLVYIDGVMWDVGEPWPRLLADGVAEGFAACHRTTATIAEFDTDALAAYLLGKGWDAGDVGELLPGFRPQRHVAAVHRLTSAAWHTKPSTFVKSRDSEMKRHVQEMFVPRATRVVEVEGDHFPHWRRPQEIADLLVSIAREYAA